MPNFPSAIRTNKIPVLGLTPESSGTAPTSPVDGQLWENTTDHIVRQYDAGLAAWVPWLRLGTTTGTAADGNTVLVKANNLSDLANVTTARTNLGLGTAATTNTGTGATNTILGNDARLTDQRVPTDASVTGGTAGVGVKLAANTVTAANIASATITDVQVAVANKDGVAGTPSLRTLGTGASQAAAGNDVRLSDQRTPLDASVTGGTAGSGVKIASQTITAANIANATLTDTQVAVANKDGVAGTPSLRTIGTGAQQAMAGSTTLSSIAAPTAAVSMAGFRITNLAAPTANTDAARLVDVQGAAAGIDAQPSVRALATSNIPVATGLVNGTVIDGVTLVTGDRVLLMGQSTASENGVYLVASTGAASRAVDNISANTFWFVEEGTANHDTQYVVTTNNPITLGTTALVISQFGASINYTGTAGRITVSGTTIDIAATYVGQSTITTVGTIGTGTWQGTAVGVAYGGTGAGDAPTARTNLGVARAGFAATLGALTAGTAYTVTHNLNTQDVIAQVRDASTNEYVFLDVINASTNTVTVTSGVAYAANALRIVVLPVV